MICCDLPYYRVVRNDFDNQWKDEKEYLSIIKSWQKKEYNARKLLERTRDMILDCHIQPYDSDKLYIGDVELYDDIERYLKKEWIRG